VSRVLLRAHRLHSHVRRQRHVALILVISGFVRAVIWTALIVLYLVKVPFTQSLFRDVAFVAIISLYANAATDFGQGCASLAQLAADTAHREQTHAAAAKGDPDAERAG
jgi:hypothetical protein